MRDITKKRITGFLSTVSNELCSLLKMESLRFPNVEDTLLNRFRNIQDIDKQLRCGNETLVNQIVEITNELCVAKWILDLERCTKLIYEPTVKEAATTGQTIDFCASMENGQTVYFDVKTIQPDTIDAWNKFEKDKERKLFPENVEILLDENWLGGEVWHNSFSSRGRMLEYTIELERKINNYESGDKTFFVMVFCSDGFDWRLDELEDFADFYTTRRHNPDDPFRTMENFDIEERQIRFQKNITAFCYFERPKTEIKVAKLACPIQGPWTMNRWH
jgi:hypothetical protein